MSHQIHSVPVSDQGEVTVVDYNITPDLALESTPRGGPKENGLNDQCSPAPQKTSELVQTSPVRLANTTIENHGQLTSANKYSESDSEGGDDGLASILEALQLRSRRTTKRMKQYERYIQQLEGRICCLENQWTAFSGTTQEGLPSFSSDNIATLEGKPMSKLINPVNEHKYPKFAANPTRRQTTLLQEQLEEQIPEDECISPTLNHQFWAEFQAAPSRHAIDILLGEPNSKFPNQLSDIEQKQRLDDAKNDLLGKRMPERVRFNSVLIQTILKSFLHMGDNRHHSDYAEGWTMIRPFKPFALFHDQIREHLLVLVQAMQRETDPLPTAKENAPQLRSEIDHRIWRTFLDEFDMYCCENCIEVFRVEWYAIPEYKSTCLYPKTQCDMLFCVYLYLAETN